MTIDQMPCMKAFCLGQLSYLEQLEGPWLELMACGEPEMMATTLRMLLAHMTWGSKLILQAMVLDEMEMELAITRRDVHNDVHGLGMSTDI